MCRWSEGGKGRGGHAQASREKRRAGPTRHRLSCEAAQCDSRRLTPPLPLQTAAVAGAVAVASYAHALASPWGAILTGGVAGMVAVWSITGLQPALDKALFFDASATLSAHVIPTLIGAVGSAIAFNRVTADLGYADQQVSPAAAALPAWRPAPLPVLCRSTSSCPTRGRR